MKNLCVFLLLFTIVRAQTIDFTNDAFEDYVFNELVVDTNNDANADVYVDANGNGLIELFEAAAVEYFVFRNNLSDYFIESVADLEHFPQLKGVSIFSVPGLSIVEDFNQPNLKSLWIYDFGSMDRIDVSTFTQLEDLRIEGVQYIRELNLQNGYVSQYQSLFYSENIEFACVDSIAHEYDDVVWRMPNQSPMLQCTLGGVNVEKYEVTIAPNPCDDQLQLPLDWDADGVFLINLQGKQMPVRLNNHVLDCTVLPSGVYLLKYTSEQQKLQIKIAVQH